VVVLDHVEARAREGVRQVGEVCDRAALGLERRAGEGPVARARRLAQSRDAEAWPFESLQVARRKRDIDELHLGLQRAVAEEHVHELSRLVSRGAGRQRDIDLERAARRADGIDARHDLAQHVLVVDRIERHLHALLGCERAGPRVDPGGGCPNAVSGDDAFAASAHAALGAARVNIASVAS